jgi:hypothetical protein
MTGHRSLIMQYILKTLTRLPFLFLPFTGLAQSSLIQRGTKQEHFLERLEMHQRDNNELNYSTFKPLWRKLAVSSAEQSDSLNRFFPYDYYYNLTPVDKSNLKSLLMNSREWVQSSKDSFVSRKPLWKTFYRDKANFFTVEEKDFFLVVNPMLQLQQSFESADNDRVFVNFKGINLRGMIAKRIGFDAYVSDNQERGPEFFRNKVAEFDAVPGGGFYKPFKTTAVDYLDARGSIFFNGGKYFDFQFGYDKNFIGNGYRSLFLSDYGNSYLFFRMNAHVWKISYNMIVMELVPQTINISSGDKILDKKYTTIHHFSINATKWLNLGLFDAVIFGRENHLELSYLNPIIFLRAAEQQNGSADNAMLGFDWKANAGHQGQFYGQFLFDEFKLSEMRAGNGWWGNKFGVQLGAKYMDAFELKNFDMQAEVNIVRPFTYSHFDSIANYSHYNQPLAHPLGANFIESIAILRYQPYPKWSGQLKLIFWQQGIDSVNSNFGSNIFKLNSTRSHGDYDYELLDGIRTNAMNLSGLVSYEWRENFFIESSLMYRHWKPKPDAAQNTFMFTLGIRLNMARREYDY